MFGLVHNLVAALEVESSSQQGFPQELDLFDLAYALLCFADYVDKHDLWER